MIEGIKILRKIEDENFETLENNMGDFMGSLGTIGEGGNAVVGAWENEKINGICFKKIKNDPVIKGNDLENEFDTQLELFKEGISVPKPIGILKDEKNSIFFLMERVYGSSIEDISAGKAFLPNNFNMELFLKKLEEEIKKMHKIGYVHRDLRGGNVMVNEKGNPVIIDFGTTVKTTNYGDLGMSVYEESITIYNPIKKSYEVRTGYFMNDLDESMPLLKSMLKSAYWRSKGYVQTDQFGQPL